MDWKGIWNDIVNFFKTNIWNIVLFFAVLFIGIVVIKLFINVLRRILNKTKMEKIAVGFIITVIKVLLYLCLILALLSIIGIEITGILTALSALLLTVGLALQNNIANLANGIIIVSSKMFKKGDYIQVDGKEGSISSINFLFTTLITPDNKRITIPNSSIVNGAVVDYDSHVTRRVDFKFTVAYESDVELVKKVVKDCMVANGKVLLTPEPFCRLSGMGDSSLEVTARCWCDREDYWDVYFDTMESVFNELKRNKISIPFNQIEVRERNDEPPVYVVGDGLPERVEKVRENHHNINLENASLSEIFSVRRGEKKDKKEKKGKQKKNKEASTEVVDVKETEEQKEKVETNETNENQNKNEDKGQK